MKKKLDDIIEKICDGDPRYKFESYEFVLDALSFTQKKYKRTKHVSGKELLEGIKILLMEEFGPLALTVLRHWGINNTDDFGNIVFNLVNNRVLSKTDNDTIDDFRSVYDFDTVFNEVYRNRLNKKISQLR